MLRDDLLAFRAVEVAQVLLGQLARAVAQGDGQFAQPLRQLGLA